MNTIFWIFSIFSIICIIWNIIHYKNYFSILTYTLFGVYIPLFLSFVNWSSYHIEKRSSIFYLIFIGLDIICIIFAFVNTKSISVIKNVKFIKKKSVIPMELYNIVYIICVLLENKYLSGYYFPSLNGLDVHTGRMPFIYFITTATYVVVIGDVIEFLSTKKIKYIVYAVGSFLINVVSKSARVDAGIALIQVGSFLLFCYLSQEKKVIKNEMVIKKKKSRLLIIALITIVFIFIVGKGMEIGNDRMNSFGKYKTVYSKGISYTGPDSPSDFLSYYYGYFALSFDNLDYNIKYTACKQNFIGLNSFRCLYFGLLQFDNIFGLDGGASSRANMIRCKGAAVATTFWDFYYDYDVLSFIPIVITFLIALFFTRRLIKEQSALMYISYFFWIPLWMFSSFDNRSYDFQIIWQLLIMWLIYRNRFVLITDENNKNNVYRNIKKKIIKVGRIKV